MTQGSERDPENTPAEKALREYIDVEFKFHDGLNAACQAELHETLQDLAGLDSFSVTDKLIVLRYDPLRLTEKKLIEKIKSTGLKVEEVESAAASPLTDALAHEEPPAADESEQSQTR